MPSLKTTSARPTRQQQQQQQPLAATPRRPQQRFSGDISKEACPPLNSPAATQTSEAERRSPRCAESVTPATSRNWRRLKAAAIMATIPTPQNLPDITVSNDDEQPNNDRDTNVSRILLAVPLDIGHKSFDECELSNQLAIIDERAEDEMWHLLRRQQRKAARMRNGLYQLVPVGSTTQDASKCGDVMFGDDVGMNVTNCSEELTPGNGGAVTRATNDDVVSTKDIVGTGGKRKSSGKVRRFRLWFDVSGFDRETVRVDFDVSSSSIEVSAATMTDSEPLPFCRAISVSSPDPIDRHSIRAVRTADGLLVVEGLTSPEGQSSQSRRHRRRHRGDVTHADRSFSSVIGRLRDALRSNSFPVQKSESFGSRLTDDNNQRTTTGRGDDGDDASAQMLVLDNDGHTTVDEESHEDEASEDGSTGRLQSVAGSHENTTATIGKKPQREKLGVATFYKDDCGVRRMKLVVDMGKAFHGSDVVLQYIKDDLIQVKAKNQFKSKERSSRARFNRKYELTEKIECRSLAGRFDPSNGRLIVEANAKRASTTGDFAVMIGNICRICIGPTNATMKAGGDADGRMMIDNCETGGECSMKMEQT